jgi:hypothetical protein
VDSKRTKQYDPAFAENFIDAFNIFLERQQKKVIKLAEKGTRATRRPAF